MMNWRAVAYGAVVSTLLVGCDPADEGLEAASVEESVEFRSITAPDSRGFCFGDGTHPGFDERYVVIYDDSQPSRFLRSDGAGNVVADYLQPGPPPKDFVWKVDCDEDAGEVDVRFASIARSTSGDHWTSVHSWLYNYDADQVVSATGKYCDRFTQFQVETTPDSGGYFHIYARARNELTGAFDWVYLSETGYLRNAPDGFVPGRTRFSFREVAQPQ
ncbi:MAG: hypothetical protein AAF799_02875 [Myxococcota bacterium]